MNTLYDMGQKLHWGYEIKTLCKIFKSISDRNSRGRTRYYLLD